MSTPAENVGGAGGTNRGTRAGTDTGTRTGAHTGTGTGARTGPDKGTAESPSPPGALRIRILGPVRVEAGGREIGLGPQQRVLLAALVLARGQAISRARLIDLLWEGDVPDGAAAAATLRAHVLHLRRVLEPDRRGRGRLGFEVLVSVGGAKDTSYALRLADDQVDATQFVRLAQRARDALGVQRPEDAVRLLDRALALWDGAALTGVDGRSFAVAEAARLEELRLVAREDRLDALLALGRHQDVIDEVRALVGEHRLRERLWAQLILALHRCGRRADALAAYRQIYRLLADELGLEPGRPLKRLHQQVLLADPLLDRPGAPAPEGRAGPRPAMPVPRQLPPDVAAFTGREGDVRRLDELLSDGDPGPGRTLVITSVTGTAGIGKTTLAVHWMHRVADRFPDGQLYVNLRGYAHAAPAGADEALGHMLRALGVAPALVPESQDEKAALYRSLLADKRLLILLDDAAELDQVRPLLPGSPTCLVVVTSRNDLRGLTAFHDAQRIGLTVFSEEEAVTLLARIVGEERVRAEPAAAAELARLCGCLPLALRVCAANLIGSPHRAIADLARELREGNRLAELNVDGDQETAVRAAFDLSYAALPADARRLFRLLGLVPGTDVPAAAAPALAGAPAAETDRLLDLLVSRNLLETYRAGRFHFHDLVRLYARERCEEEDTAEERDTALRRLLAWYQSTADGAARGLYGEFYSHLPVPCPEAGGAPVAPLDFGSPLDALGWLNEERGNLLAAIDHAARTGPYPFAWEVAHTLHGYLHLMSGGSKAEWLRISLAGLGAAEAAGDRCGQGLMHWSLGNVRWEMAEYAAAVRHSELAVAALRRAGLSIERGGALLVLAAAQQALGRPDPARDHARRALEAFRSIGHAAGEALSLGQMGFLRLDRGRFDAALDLFRRARTTAERSGYPAAAAFATWGMGIAQHRRGRHGEAVRHLEEVLAPSDQPPPSYVEEGALRDLAVVCRDSGEHHLALKHVSAALSVVHRTHRRLFEADVHQVLGTVLSRLDDAPGAAEHHALALRLAGETGCRRAEAAARIGLAEVHRRQGRGADAAVAAEAALATSRECGLAVLEGAALVELARARLLLGEPAAAREAAEAAVANHGRSGHRLGTAQALGALGDALRALGRPEAADAHQRRAAALCELIGAPLPGAEAPHPPRRRG
ncbi:AfsR/SARP family transcriptional regulator [Streptomyces sp. URMC 123]|uniref:AfsR/SARP family transcriptional regulator n=1 Tax=Streptomyces sp. URMC 123 TaxID=3423403 RepID=UPI003F1DDED5